MLEKMVRISQDAGLHLRPAADVCTLAMNYSSTIYIYIRDRQYNAKSLLSVLSAGIKEGENIRLVITGSDEDQAMGAMLHLLENGKKIS